MVGRLIARSLTWGWMSSPRRKRTTKTLVVAVGGRSDSHPRNCCNDTCVAANAKATTTRGAADMRWRWCSKTWRALTLSFIQRASTRDTARVVVHHCTTRLIIMRCCRAYCGKRIERGCRSHAARPASSTSWWSSTSTKKSPRSCRYPTGTISRWKSALAPKKSGRKKLKLNEKGRGGKRSSLPSPRTHQRIVRIVVRCCRTHSRSRRCDEPHSEMSSLLGICLIRWNK